MEKKLNTATKTYTEMNKQWGLNKKKAADFSKGASQSGSLVSPDVKDKLSAAWKALTK